MVLIVRPADTARLPAMILEETLCKYRFRLKLSKDMVRFATGSGTLAKPITICQKY